MMGSGINYKKRSLFPTIIRTIGILAILLITFFLLFKIGIFFKELLISRSMYVGSNKANVQLIEDFETLSLSLDEVPRGTKITTYGFGKKIELTGEVYFKSSFVNNEGRKVVGYINQDNIVKDYSECVYEKRVYARTTNYISPNNKFSEELSIVDKGERFLVKDWELNDDGTIKWYFLKNIKKEGYSSGKYYTIDVQEAALVYDYNNYFESYNLSHLDYYPRKKNEFKDNPKLIDARTWYLTYENLSYIDEFIELALETNINSFVVDVKVPEGIVYESDIVKHYASETENITGFYYQEFQEIINQLKENGFYTIARVVVFNDSGYASSNPENSIFDNSTNKPFIGPTGTMYTSPYQREVWEYNVNLSKEIAKFGFNEILFDYVRFPIIPKKTDVNIDYREEYDETREQAIQRFSMYAYDQLTYEEVYVSSTMLGQTAYFVIPDKFIHGQQWHALSNVYDYLYPYIFVENYTPSYTRGYYPYHYQYELVYRVMNRMNSLNRILLKSATPRVIIQSYNNWYKPNWKDINGEYLNRQIQAIYDTGNFGFVAWTTDPTTEKYTHNNRLEAFKENYEKKEFSGAFK